MSSTQVWDDKLHDWVAGQPSTDAVELASVGVAASTSGGGNQGPSVTAAQSTTLTGSKDVGLDGSQSQSKSTQDTVVEIMPVSSERLPLYFSG